MALFLNDAAEPRSPEPMSPVSLLAALGVACLASVVWIVRTAPPPTESILDRVYR
jgi:hypothetical protein